MTSDSPESADQDTCAGPPQMGQAEPRARPLHAVPARSGPAASRIGVVRVSDVDVVGALALEEVRV